MAITSIFSGSVSLAVVFGACPLASSYCNMTAQLLAFWCHALAIRFSDTLLKIKKFKTPRIWPHWAWFIFSCDSSWKVKVLVAQSCPTLCDPVGHSSPFKICSSIHSPRRLVSSRLRSFSELYSAHHWSCTLTTITIVIHNYWQEI